MQDTTTCGIFSHALSLCSLFFLLICLFGKHKSQRLVESQTFSLHGMCINAPSHLLFDIAKYLVSKCQLVQCCSISVYLSFHCIKSCLKRCWSQRFRKRKAHITCFILTLIYTRKSFQKSIFQVFSLISCVIQMLIFEV